MSNKSSFSEITETYKQEFKYGNNGHYTTKVGIKAILSQNDDIMKKLNEISEKLNK